MEQPSARFNDILDTIRAFAATKGWKPARLAREAGLSDMVVRGMERDDWSPSGTSVRALERLIPADWKAGDPLPDGQGTSAAAKAAAA